MKPEIFHLIPRWVLSNTYQGCYKDTISRIIFLQQIGNYRQLLLDNDVPDQIEAALSTAVNPVFLVEYSRYPRVVQWLRARYPDAMIAVRAHNLEPLQHLDNVGWWPSKGPLWTAYGMTRIALADIACKRFASIIYSINEWENDVYWNRLPGRARVEWLPYCCPAHLLPSSRGEATVRNRIVCLPTSQKNRKSLDLVSRFYRFAEATERSAPGLYQFQVTGDLLNWGLPPSSAVTLTGMVADLTALLATAKAVCVLSPLGYGFKTTIGDALAHGCVPLVHPRLASRLPFALQEAVVCVDTESTSSMRESLNELQQARPRADLDRSLREAAERLLCRDLGPSSIPGVSVA